MRFAAGAAWGLAAAGLLAAHLRAPAWPFWVAGAAMGAVLAAAWPRWDALRHPRLAVLAAACGVIIVPLPEPTFFLLVPLVAAAVAWPLREPDGAPQRIPRALPAWTLPAAFVLGAASFFLQAANRFWQYAAGAKDLGLFHQTHWLIAHGLPPLNTVMGMHALADHMELLDYVVAPLLRLHAGPETLLLVQALAAASGVFPLGWLAMRLLEGSRAGLAVALVWLLAPDLHAAVLFDYNPMVMGAAGLLWTAWALLTRGLAASLIAALVTCLAREDMCLYVAALAAVLALRGVPFSRAASVIAAALALFAFEMLVLVPRFRPEGFRHFEQFTEAAAGPTSDSGALEAPPAGPGFVGRLVDHPQKRRSMLQPLVATGFVGAADPLSLALQVPNWIERFFSSYRTRWWGYHYGAPAAATALVGLVLGWARLRRAERDGPRLGVFAVLCALLTGLVPPYATPALREHGVRRSEMYGWRAPYAMAPADVATANAAVRFIGPNPYLVVAAQDRLLPHLSGRRTILMLDRAQEAEVIAVQMNGATWPDGRPTWRRRMGEIAASGAFGVVFCKGQTVVLQRAAASVPCPAWEALVEDVPTAAPREPAA